MKFENLAVLCFLGITHTGIMGCASVDVTPLTPDDTTTVGVRFYEPQPYLLVTLGKQEEATTKPADGKPKADISPTAAEKVYTLRVIYLPNFRRGYALRVKSGLGVGEGAAKLADGWQLTDFNAKADTKIPETITAVTGLVKEVAGLIPKGTDPDRGLVPGIYRMDFDPAGVLSALTLVRTFAEPK